MFATWPMVVGALVAGFIAGFLMPDTQQKPQASSKVAAKSETVEKSEAKRTLPPATTAAVPAPTTTATTTTKSEPATAGAESVASTGTSSSSEDCERQTWPYLTPNCLDRSAQAATPDVVVKTKRTETKPEMNAEPKAPPAQQAASSPNPPKETETVSAPKAETSAPKADTTAKSAAASPAATAAAEKPQTPQAAPAAAEKAAPPPAEKAARRPATRPRTERAEVPDEPLRPRADRYRNERRYAGPMDDDDRPVYVERNGRLYLAPEYQQRLRGPDRYWRDW